MRNVGNGNAAEFARYLVEMDKPFLVVLELVSYSSRESS
jgi:hypothetical protein